MAWQAWAGSTGHHASVLLQDRGTAKATTGKMPCVNVTQGLHNEASNVPIHAAAAHRPAGLTYRRFAAEIWGGGAEDDAGCPADEDDDDACGSFRSMQHCSRRRNCSSSGLDVRGSGSGGSTTVAVIVALRPPRRRPAGRREDLRGWDRGDRCGARRGQQTWTTDRTAAGPHERSATA